MKLIPQSLSHFLTLTTDIFGVFDLSGHFVEVSESSEKALGYKVGELVSHSALEFTHPEDYQRTTEVWQKLIKDRISIQNFENRYLCKNGKEKWFSWSYGFTTAPDLIYTIGRDITHLKQTEKSLREETQALNTLNQLEAALALELDLEKLAYTIIDSGTSLTKAAFGAFFYSRAGTDGKASMLYSISGLPKESFDSFPLPRMTGVFGATFEGMEIVRSSDITQDPRYGGLGPHFELPEGHPPVKSYLGIPVISNNEEVLGGLFFGHPEPGAFTERSERIGISIASYASIALNNARLYEKAQIELEERKKAEEQLRQTKELLESLILSSPVGIHSMDLDGNTTLWNPASEAMYGWNSDEVLGKSVPFIPREGLAGFQALLKRLKSGEIITAEKSVRKRKDGSLIHITISAAPIRGSGGLISGIASVTQDITEKTLLEEQLLHADRMVALGTLSAGVAHEINNPLAYVLLNLSMATEELNQLKDKEKAAQEEEIKLISQQIQESHQGIERVANIVKGLKAFSRQEETKVSLLDVNQVLTSSANMAMAKVKHRARLIRDFAQDLPLVLGNEAKLGQTLLNLIINAAEAISDDQIEENYVALRSSLNDAGNIVITIEDSGAGMSPEVKARLFDPFFTTKPIGVGTGLGLSISHGIITSMKGTIEVESEVGQGTTFTIVLPKAEALSLPSSEPTEPLPLAPKRNARVIIIDDEVAVASALQIGLKRDYSVTISSDAETALAILRQDPAFDVILCDVHMSNVSGIEFFKRLRDDSLGLERKVIFMTGGITNHHYIQFLSSIPNKIIEKPFDVRSLRALFNEVLS